MKKVVIFPSNKVLDSSRAWRYFSKALTLSPSELSLIKEKYFLPAKRGILLKKEFIDKLSKNLDISKKELLNIFEVGGKMLKVNKKLINFAKKLKKERYEVIIIGTSTDLLASLKVEKKTYGEFSKSFMSYQLKALKSEPRFYKKLFKLIKKNENDVVFYENESQTLKALK
jgi:FMN phosphatase YigB (HAD superfamily)